jgi:predicted ATPase
MNETLPPSSSQVVWDEEHVKALLFEPETLIVDEPWRSWVKMQGGLGEVRDALLGLALSEKHHRTLKSILSEPGASLQRYSLLMHTSVATFVRYRTSLVKMLVAILNSHGQEKPSRAGVIVPNNLPKRSASLIGREKELGTIGRLLRKEDVGLLTITGPGGIGKTRLALQTALDFLPEFEDGVFFISLASISSPDLVAPTIVQTLGLTGADNFPVQELLKNHLQDKHLLMVLDNFEQVTAAAPLLGELLGAAPGLKILVTSRAVLHVYGEYEFNVPPLLVPELSPLPPLKELSVLPSVALFVNRAQTVNSDFVLSQENAPIIAEICVRLEGIPLALELAAARSKLFAPQALLRELSQRFALLAYRSIDREPRHQTLRNAVAWSYQLLSQDEQSLFAQLGVFVGGCTLDAVESTCIVKNTGISVSERLASLVDKSMLQHETRPNGEPRFILLENLREYALEQLEQDGQTQAALRRHLAYFLQLVESIEPGPQEPNLPAWMNQLEEEHDNLRAALRRALLLEEYDVALRIAGAIWRFWQIHGHVEEGARWMEQILAHSTGQESMARAKSLWGAGWLGMVMGSLEQAQAYFEEGARLSRQLGNQRYLGLSLHGLGAVARGQGDFARSRAAFEESLPLFRALQNSEDVAWTFEHLGATALDQGEFEQAAAYLQQGLALFQKLDQQWPCAEALTFLGHAALQQADYARARQRYEEARSIYRELDDRPNVATLNTCIGAALFGQGDYDQAISLYKDSLIILHSLNSYWGMVWSVECLAKAAAQAGRADVAARLNGAATALRRITGVLWHPGFYSQYNEQRFDALKRVLGQSEWEKLWAEGQAMSVDEAISCALEI